MICVFRNSIESFFMAGEHEMCTVSIAKKYNAFKQYGLFVIDPS